jgi:hypothetical protein
VDVFSEKGKLVMNDVLKIIYEEKGVAKAVAGRAPQTASGEVDLKYLAGVLELQNTRDVPPLSDPFYFDDTHLFIRSQLWNSLKQDEKRRLLQERFLRACSFNTEILAEFVKLILVMAMFAVMPRLEPAEDGDNFHRLISGPASAEGFTGKEYKTIKPTAEAGDTNSLLYYLQNSYFLHPVIYFFFSHIRLHYANKFISHRSPSHQLVHQKYIKRCYYISLSIFIIYCYIRDYISSVSIIVRPQTAPYHFLTHSGVGPLPHDLHAAYVHRPSSSAPL